MFNHHSRAQTGALIAVVLLLVLTGCRGAGMSRDAASRPTGERRPVHDAALVKGAQKCNVGTVEGRRIVDDAWVSIKAGTQFEAFPALGDDDVVAHGGTFVLVARTALRSCSFAYTEAPIDDEICVGPVSPVIIGGTLLRDAGQHFVGGRVRTVRSTGEGVIRTTTPDGGKAILPAGARVGCPAQDRQER